MRFKLLVFALILTFLPFSFTYADQNMAMSISDQMIEAGELTTIYFDVPSGGYVNITALDGDGVERAVIASEFEAADGLNSVTWNGTNYGNPLPTDSYQVVIQMGDKRVQMEILVSSDAEPFEPSAEPTAEADAPEEDIERPAEAAQIVETAQTEPVTGDQAAFTPAMRSTFTPAMRSTFTPDHDPDGCYWCTPMDITDEAAVWAMLTAPITVIEAGQKEQLIIRAEPSDSAEGVGVVTGTSQSVHVLKDNGDGWTLIECYSSSFHDSKVKRWNAFVTGYVRTNKLVRRTPAQDYGIVIDKLTQMLYLFKDGHLFTELSVSTGQYNERQPYNETRSGEFMLVSKVGDFRSDAMICATAMRFNSGDLLHEVPHVKNADGTKNYKSTEYKLRGRGSHGCIRVQRLKNPEGVNMLWLWKNLTVDSKSGTKLVIWEDFAGRTISAPSDDTPVYYNPNGGTGYHSSATCNGVRDQYLPLTQFTYGELENSTYKDLKPCQYCNPPLRLSEIEKINQEHAQTSPGMVDDYHNQ